ncbi:hypothetical protein KIPB_005203 [Kipferlia bialata]|uniref:Uncharacterized protein n=2 Tax=Kipferlia bialata TaxID=797122 RepID=A0A9K3CV81_9EUKA|nr:hypothetical protein KIPB_005203 [Kipferlia bialata]|eukprot:g5203.t1
MDLSPLTSICQRAAGETGDPVPTPPPVSISVPNREALECARCGPFLHLASIPTPSVMKGITTYLDGTETEDKDSASTTLFLTRDVSALPPSCQPLLSGEAGQTRPYTYISVPDMSKGHSTMAQTLTSEVRACLSTHPVRAVVLYHGLTASHLRLNDFLYTMCLSIYRGVRECHEGNGWEEVVRALPIELHDQNHTDSRAIKPDRYMAQVQRALDTVLTEGA